MASACAAEHALEHGEAVVVRDNLLKSDCSNVQFRTRGRHVGIAFVGTYHNIARLGDAEIAARHAGIGRQELVSQAKTGNIGEVGGVMIALFTA